MSSPAQTETPVRRAVCDRCRRALSVCYCAHLHTLPTRTRVIVVQHPREEGKAIGTARMAHLCLPNSVLRVGLDFSVDEVVAPALESPSPAYLLFPSERAVDVRDLPRDPAITLVVVDGTWWQARKLLKLNPALSALPHLGFSRAQPSEYRIRREPADFCVSTIEALAEVLNVLESEAGEPIDTFNRLLDPFRAMVDRQIEFQNKVRSQRHRKLNRFPRVARRPTLSMRLGKMWDRLVCVQGEANGWPRFHPDKQPAEMVHWVAHRVATGETYEAIIRPRRPLAPATPTHIRLPEEKLTHGISLEEWRTTWSKFLRPDDVVAHWGGFGRELATQDGLPFPPLGIDVRGAVRQLLHERIGTIENCELRLETDVGVNLLQGRAGDRLSALVRVLRALRKI